MAVYIKQSPPREGVRGGWEDFKWDSLKTQSHADRDYYLGASAKVGICTRGKFEKYDWWTKKREDQDAGGEADDELPRVKRFEQQLLDEALGKKPRLLLAGEALPDEEVPKPPAAPEGLDVEKALKKIRKEQKRLKKLRKRERKREARRMRLKRERRSHSRSNSERPSGESHIGSKSASGSSSRSKRRKHSHRRSQSSSHSPSRRGGRSVASLRMKRCRSEEAEDRESPRRNVVKRESRDEDCFQQAQRRRQSPYSKRGRSSFEEERRGEDGRERARDKVEIAGGGEGRTIEQRRRRVPRSPDETPRLERRRHSRSPQTQRSCAPTVIRAKDKEDKVQRKSRPLPTSRHRRRSSSREKGERRRGDRRSPEHTHAKAPSNGQQASDRRAKPKAELVDKERAAEQREKDRTRRDTQDSRGDLARLRIKREV
ncbi:hypothetical protein Esti_004058 [Eimeria stiedai]